jgi:hypothetical protein
LSKPGRREGAHTRSEAASNRVKAAAGDGLEKLNTVQSLAGPVSVRIAS